LAQGSSKCFFEGSQVAGHSLRRSFAHMASIAVLCISTSLFLLPAGTWGGNVSDLTSTTADLGESEDLWENSSDLFTEDDLQAADLLETGSSYNFGEARACARISAATYCRRGGPGVTHVKLVGSGAELAAVGRWRGHCIVAFRGTDNVESALEDFISLRLVPLPGCQGCEVGEGILDAYNRVAGGIKSALHSLGCSQVSVTGHSLGANMAILALLDLAQSGFHLRTSYTFGQSRVGNTAFHNSWKAAVHCQVFRFVHGEDPIVHLGPIGSWTHEGTEIYLAGASVAHDHSCYLGIGFKKEAFLRGHLGRVCGTKCKMYP